MIILILLSLFIIIGFIVAILIINSQSSLKSYQKRYNKELIEEGRRTQKYYEGFRDN